MDTPTHKQSDRPAIAVQKFTGTHDKGSYGESAGGLLIYMYIQGAHGMSKIRVWVD